MALVPGLEISSGFVMSLVQTISYWLTIIVGGIVLIAIFAFVYYWMSFPIKADVYPLYGSGKDGIFSVGKRKKNRVKWIKNRMAWKSMKPWFNKKHREPFDSEFIYPGNQIYVFELNGEFLPGRVNITQSEGKIRGEINPVEHWARNWQALEHKQNAMEFAKHDFWTENRVFIWMLIAVGICAAMCIVTVYLTYKFAGVGTTQLDSLTQAIKGMTNIGGKPPG